MDVSTASLRPCELASVCGNAVIVTEGCTDSVGGKVAIVKYAFGQLHQPSFSSICRRSIQVLYTKAIKKYIKAMRILVQSDSGGFEQVSDNVVLRCTYDSNNTWLQCILTP